MSIVDAVGTLYQLSQSVIERRRVEQFAGIHIQRTRGIVVMALVSFGVITALLLPLAAGMQRSTAYDCDSTRALEVLDYQGDVHYFYVTVDLSNGCQ